VLKDLKIVEGDFNSWIEALVEQMDALTEKVDKLCREFEELKKAKQKPAKAPKSTSSRKEPRNSDAGKGVA